MSNFRRRLMMQQGGAKYNPLGVYILDTKNYLSLADDWDSNRIAVGVFVKTDNTEFIIATQDVSSADVSWGCSGLDIEGATMTTIRDEALSDYNGSQNTESILRASQGHPDKYGIVGSPAAELCHNYIFPNGEIGHFPSMGELYEAYKNKALIDSAMAKIGSAMKSGYYMSSTRYNIDIRFWDIQWGSGNVTNSDSNKAGLVRAFCKVTKVYKTLN